MNGVGLLSGHCGIKIARRASTTVAGVEERDKVQFQHRRKDQDDSNGEREATTQMRDLTTAECASLRHKPRRGPKQLERVITTWQTWLI